MFESLFRNERKEIEQSQAKQMDFQREQSAFAAASNAEQVDLVQQETKSDLIKWQQELDDELMNVVYKLKGYTRDERGVWVKPNDCIALCNDKFIEHVFIPNCKPFLSRNLINSNFTEDRILALLRNTMNDFADNMADHYDEYEIEFQNFDLIDRLTKNVIVSGAFRALQGWTKKTDSTNFRRIESSIDNQREGPQKRRFSLLGS